MNGCEYILKSTSLVLATVNMGLVVYAGKWQISAAVCLAEHFASFRSLRKHRYRPLAARAECS